MPDPESPDHRQPVVGARRAEGMNLGSATPIRASFPDRAHALALYAVRRAGFVNSGKRMIHAIGARREHAAGS
jgi:hypothetical protein